MSLREPRLHQARHRGEHFLCWRLARSDPIACYRTDGEISAPAGVASDDRFAPPVRLSGTVEAIEHGDRHTPWPPSVMPPLRV